MVSDKHENIPEFIIVGTMKSGTSTLMDHLRRHRELYTPEREVHFFDRDDNYSKGVSWYLEELLRDKPNNVKVVGEKTPTYSYKPGIAERIHQHFPDVKLVWIFRNPVDRTYSNYLHAFKAGADIYSFEKALRTEEKRIKKNLFLGYKERSIYYRQVERFLEYFPEENMFFMLFEDLIKPYHEKHVLNDLFNFLGVSPDAFTFDKKPSNKTRLPKYPRTHYYSKKMGLYKNSFSKRILDKLNIDAKTESYSKMPDSVRSELLEYFKPYNEKLEKLIELDLSAWNK